jgi:excisionase family DNA binding protein
VAKTPSDLTPISYRPKDAARVLAVSPAHLYKLLKAGKIPHRKDNTATLIDREALIAYRNSLPVFAPDRTLTGSLLSVDEQKIALERARGAGTPIPPPPPVPPPPLPRPPDIDLVAIYDGRLRLLAPKIGPTEARRRAFEFTVQAYARNFTVSLEEANEKTLTALAECGWPEPNPSPKGLFTSVELSDDEGVA